MLRSLLLMVVLLLRGFRNAEQLPNYCQNLDSNKGREVRMDPLCDHEGSNHWEIFDGEIIGLEDTVVVRIPVTSNPPPLTSDITWTGPDGRMIDVRSVVLQHDEDNTFNHLIVGIVQISGDADYGEYHVLYKGFSLINITINKDDLTAVLFEGSSYGIYRSSSLRFLITTMLSTFFGILLLSVIFLFCCSRRNITDQDKKGHKTETPVCDKSGSDQHYGFLGSAEENCYSTLDNTVQDHSL